MTLSAKAVALFVLVWLIGSWLGNTYDGYTSFDTFTSSTGVTTNNSQQLGSMISGSIASQQLPLIGNLSFLTPITTFFTSLFASLTWRFSFLTPYPMIQNIFWGFGTMMFFSLLFILWQSVRGNVTWG